MPFSISKLSRLLVFISLLGFSFTWLGCPTDVNSNPPPPSQISPPQSPKLELNSQTGGGLSYANISWTASSDAGRSDFRGYRVYTFEIDGSGNTTPIQVQLVSKNTLSYRVDSLAMGTRYFTSIRAELNDQTSSDTVSTPIYGAVFYNNDGLIKEYVQGDSTLSGFGWPFPSYTQGFPYDYKAANSGLIDLNLWHSGSTLMFYSPASHPPGSRITLLGLVGANQGAFDQTSGLAEPVLDSIAIQNEQVFLLKTKENHYIKVYVKNITQENNRSVISFWYKVQSVPGLRVL